MKRKANPSAFVMLAAIICCILFSGPGCKKQAPAQPEVFFVRDGVILSHPKLISCRVSGPKGICASFHEKRGQAFTTFNGEILLQFSWQPGADYLLEGETSKGKFSLTAGAPAKPGPFLIAEIPLEKIKNYEGQGFKPDTYVSFSPDERYVAIGSFFGYLRVVELPSGKIILKKRLAEGMVKRICWSKQKHGWILFVGEQSPDSFVYAMDALTGNVFWKYRLANDIGTSRPDGGDPRMRVYNMPGSYFMQALPDGDLLVMGLHGRYKGEDFVYDTMAYRLDGNTGKPVWQWPQDRTLPYGITWAGASEDGSVIALLTKTWLGVKVPHAKYKSGVLYCLDGVNGEVNWEYLIPPLKPYYEKISFWQGISVSRDGRHVALGLNDGRGMLFDNQAMIKRGPDATPLWVKKIGTPVMNGDIPVAASIAYTELAGNAVYFGLPGTTIPPNTAASDRKGKPAPHPMSHSICSYSLSGEPLWHWQCSASVQGIFTSPDGRWVATGITDDRGTADPDDFGMALFDSSLARQGRDPLVYRYFTEGNVFFMGAVSSTGRYVALCECPYSPDDGKTLRGAYRVHVVH